MVSLWLQKSRDPKEDIQESLEAEREGEPGTAHRKSSFKRMRFVKVERS